MVVLFGGFEWGAAALAPGMVNVVKCPKTFAANRLRKAYRAETNRAAARQKKIPDRVPYGVFSQLIAFRRNSCHVQSFLLRGAQLRYEDRIGLKRWHWNETLIFRNLLLFAETARVLQKFLVSAVRTEAGAIIFCDFPVIFYGYDIVKKRPLPAGGWLYLMDGAEFVFPEQTIPVLS